VLKLDNSKRSPEQTIAHFSVGMAFMRKGHRRLTVSRLSIRALRCDAKTATGPGAAKAMALARLFGKMA